MTLRLQVIRVVALLAAVLSLARSPLLVAVAAQVPQSLKNEDVFFYKLAICGDKPADQIDFWGTEFDRANYQSATANEFSRQEYRGRTGAMLQRRRDGLSFTTRFSAGFSGVLGEYSFSDHGFPLNITSHLRFNIGGISIYGAQPDQVVNMADYRWFVPMAEAQASAYIKSHQDSSGNVDRKVLLNITYSIVEATQKCRPYDIWLKSYFHSIDVFDARNSGVKIVTLRPSTTPEQAKSEAPVRLRTLIATLPELQGGYFTLRIRSFDSGTGAVVAEIDFNGGGRTGSTYDPPLAKSRDGHSSRAVGIVSGDTLTLTATWAEKLFLGKVEEGLIRVTLQYDGIGHKLAGMTYWGDQQQQWREMSFPFQ